LDLWVLKGNNQKIVIDLERTAQSFVVITEWNILGLGRKEFHHICRRQGEVRIPIPFSLAGKMHWAACRCNEAKLPAFAFLR
jgi:hypothetical protein